MRYVNSYKSRRFRAKPAGSQRYALVTILQGKTNFIDREIALRAYQYRDIISIGSLGCIRA